MKKILVTLAAMLFAVSTMVLTCSAATVEVVDNMSSTVAVTVDAVPGSYVSVTVLNPDYTEADFASSPLEAVQYFKTAIATNSAECGHDGNYCFHFSITGDGGQFTIITNANGVKESQPFSFYPAARKQDIIDDINDADTISNELVVSAMRNFSLKDIDLFKNLDPEGSGVAAIADAIEALKPEDGFAKDTAEDLNNMMDVLKDACLIAAYNTDNETLLTDGEGSLLYLENIMNLSGTDELEDYEFISDKDIITDDLFDGTYTTVEDIEDAFKEAIRFRVLVDYHMRGYGHVEYYFDRYFDYYEEVGFDFDEFEDRNDKDDICSDVASSNASNIVSLKNKFNNMVNKDESGRGGSSSGGISFGGGTAPNNTAVEEEPVTPVTPVVPPVETVGGFSDVPVTHWAAEPIKALVDDGILSGRGNGTFDTDGTITRAELIKIAVLSTMDKVDETASNPFEDSANHWAKAHIATAVKAGITTGVNEKEFNPDGLITREQAATILYRAVKAKGVELKTTDEKFADDASISEWAREGVYALKVSGVISGKGDNSFCPSDNLTRAEAAKLIYTIQNLK